MRALLKPVLVALAITLVLPSRASPQDDRPVLFFAAASLQTALNAIAAEWQRETGRRVTFAFAASSVLARQMEQGAPADLFASADLDWMDYADQRGLIRRDSRRDLLGNALVLITQRENATELGIAPGFPLVAALGDSRLAIGNPQSVPAGRYAREALTSLGVWSEVAPRIAGTENVRAALALVARGEVRFGIVYRTDATSDPRVRVIGTFPPGTHPAIVYPVALTASSRRPEAEALLRYLSSPTATRVFEAQGFTVLP